MTPGGKSTRPAIVLSVEAGEWLPEEKLRALSERAVEAADKVLALHASAVSISRRSPCELSILFTNDAAIRKLNQTWRGKDSPTNVLSFPQAAGPLLGDVILSAETVAKEAALADKPLEDHMLHLIIHGYLHLLGFDHEAEDEAEKMEQLERVALRELGIPDPYATASGQ
jgi:probable rRNA maturation factor